MGFRAGLRMVPPHEPQNPAYKRMLVKYRDWESATTGTQPLDPGQNARKTYGPGVRHNWDAALGPKLKCW